MSTPDNPLWHLANRIAEWLHREGLLEHDKAGMQPWAGTFWRDEGYLPSGDRFDLRLVYDDAIPATLSRT